MSILFPDSKITEVTPEEHISFISISFSFLFLGRNPKNLKLSISKPETLKAVIMEVTPGIGTICIPSAINSFTKYLPGSEIKGVPASLIIAISFPWCSCWISPEVLLFSENFNDFTDFD